MALYPSLMKLNRPAMLLIGVVIGVALVLAGQFASVRLGPRLFGPYGYDNPGVTTGSCRGVDYVVTLAQARTGMGLFGSVAVGETDKPWQIHWDRGPSGGDLASPGGVQPSTDGVVGQAQQVGDLDDGAQRQVRLRPAGDSDWCRATVRLTP